MDAGPRNYTIAVRSAALLPRQSPLRKRVHRSFSLDIPEMDGRWSFRTINSPLGSNRASDFWILAAPDDNRRSRGRGILPRRANL